MGVKRAWQPEWFGIPASIDTNGSASVSHVLALRRDQLDRDRPPPHRSPQHPPAASRSLPRSRINCSCSSSSVV